MLKELRYYEIDTVVGGVCAWEVLQYIGHGVSSAGITATFVAALFKDAAVNPNIRARVAIVVASAAIASATTVLIDIYAANSIFSCKQN